MKKKRIDRFKNSRMQLWVFGGAALALCLLSMIMFGEKSVPIVVAAIGGAFALATGQTVITNYAESQNPEYYLSGEPYGTEE